MDGRASSYRVTHGTRPLKNKRHRDYPGGALLCARKDSHLEAGNTVETLRAVDVNDAAPTRGLPEETVVALEVPFDAELSETVSREEFEELRDAFLRLLGRIDKFNLGAPHRI